MLIYIYVCMYVCMHVCTYTRAGNRPETPQLGVFVAEAKMTSRMSVPVLELQGGGGRVGGGGGLGFRV